MKTFKVCPPNYAGEVPHGQSKLTINFNFNNLKTLGQSRPTAGKAIAGGIVGPGYFSSRYFFGMFSTTRTAPLAVSLDEKLILL